MCAKLDEFLSQFDKQILNNFDFTEAVYVTASVKVQVSCRAHGPFLVTPGRMKERILSGKSICPKCNKHSAAAKLTMSNEDFLAKIRAVHGERYDLSQVSYSGAKGKVTVSCKEHGSFDILPGNLLNGVNCAKCELELQRQRAVGARLTQETFLSRAKAVHGDAYDYSEAIVVNSKTPVKVRCKTHNTVFYPTPGNHLNSGTGCPLCGSEKAHKDFRKPLPTLENEILEVLQQEGLKVDLSNYVNNKSIIQVICPKHGPWESRINDILTGHAIKQCPICYPPSSISSLELEIVELLKEHYSGEILTSDRSTLGNRELDILMPDLNLAIEVNGLYWHSESGGKDKTYHLHKTEACLEKGIHLIHLAEDEWVMKKEIVRSKLIHLVGGAKDKVFARKLVLRKVPMNEAKQFTDQNHLQGGGPVRTLNYGLYLGDELKALLAMIPARFGDTREGSYEVLRYVTSTTVVGGFSRLLKAFVEETPDARIIVSFSDKRWSQGGLYSKTGFTHVGATEPGYDYVNNRYQRVNREIFMKHKGEDNVKKGLLKSFSPELTELENCVRSGWYRTWNCGMDKWEMQVR